MALNGLYESALALLDHKTIKRFRGERWKLYANRGYWQSRIHKPDKAIRSFKKAICNIHNAYELNLREYAGLLNGLGYQYSELRHYKSALPYFQKSLEIRNALIEGKDDSANSLNAMGYAYKMTGRIPQAKECFLAALSLRQKAFGNNNPIVAESYNSIASIFQIDGNIEGAIVAMGNAVAVYERFAPPDDKRLHVFRQRLESYLACASSAATQ
ncbi:MAG: tetratricopeptide repeat protein [Rectinemataceae bacterium]